MLGLTSLSLLYNVNLNPGNKSDLLFTSSSANSAAGRHAWPPCHPPLPAIGKMPPMCSSSKPFTRWLLDVCNAANNQTMIIHCDVIVCDLNCRTCLPLLTPILFDAQILLGIMNHFSHVSCVLLVFGNKLRFWILFSPSGRRSRFT